MTEPRAPALVPIGRITRAHGVRGDLTVIAYGDTLGDLGPGEALELRPAPCGDPGARLTVRRVRPQPKGRCLLSVDEVDDRDSAQALAGTELCVPRDRLATLGEGEYYAGDLVGLRVRTEDGAQLGVLHGLIDVGPHDVLDVRDGDRELLLPATDEVILSVDPDAGVMVVRPLEAPASPAGTGNPGTGNPGSGDA